MSPGQSCAIIYADSRSPETSLAVRLTVPSHSCVSSLFLHKPLDETQLPLRRFDAYIPFVPSREEVSILIDAMSDLKQKAMVSRLYPFGLRVSEVCHLRYEDIDCKSIEYVQAKPTAR